MLSREAVSSDLWKESSVNDQYLSVDDFALTLLDNFDSQQLLDDATTYEEMADIFNGEIDIFVGEEYYLPYAEETILDDNFDDGHFENVIFNLNKNREVSRTKHVRFNIDNDTSPKVPVENDLPASLSKIRISISQLTRR